MEDERKVMTEEDRLVGMVEYLWQVSQTANQPAATHVQCQNFKEAVVTYIRRPKDLPNQ